MGMVFHIKDERCLKTLWHYAIGGTTNSTNYEIRDGVREKKCPQCTQHYDGACIWILILVFLYSQIVVF